MKYVITGSSGNVSRLLSEKLLEAGHQVGVIGRNPTHLEGLVRAGAIPHIGSIEDIDFLKTAFKGADAVFTMIPAKFETDDLKGWIEGIGKNYAKAIQANGIKYMVNLSSVGAHMSEGCGPVSGLYRAEQNLNRLKDVEIIHLRPCYFFLNFLGSVGMIKQMNFLGNNFGGDHFVLPLVHPSVIAAVAFESLNNLDFSGHTVKYIASDERKTDEIAKVLGQAVGKPDLAWVVFTDEQALDGMIRSGLPPEIAKNYTEMGHALHSGVMLEDYWKTRKGLTGKYKLEDFAPVFAAVYNNN